MQRANVDVISDAMVDAITFEGCKATGIRFSRWGQARVAKAQRAVILAAGAIQTPQLLQVSGVGPPDLLNAIGVKVVHAMPGVGEGLQDHYAVRVAARVKGVQTLNERARGANLCWEVATWYATGKSMIAFSPAHAAAFVRSKAHFEAPDLQFVFTPASYSEGMIGQLQDFPGMTTGTWQMRPESRGYVRARSADIHDAPVIQPNYLAREADQRALVAGMKQCRAFLATSPLAPFYDGETLPGGDVQSDDELLAYARERGATVYHAVSTCRMGSDDMAVVDEQLRVKGLDNLRIIDASVMPTMPSANTNAATMMIAEKGADLLKAAGP